VVDNNGCIDYYTKFLPYWCSYHIAFPHLLAWRRDVGELPQAERLFPSGGTCWFAAMMLALDVQYSS
jgi:hypothetical protein